MVTQTTGPRKAVQLDVTARDGRTITLAIDAWGRMSANAQPITALDDTGSGWFVVRTRVLAALISAADVQTWQAGW
jgi:hypothetical protein